MEFKLNKIDTDIRKRMQEERNTDKVHSGSSITVRRDLKDDKDTDDKKHEMEKRKEKKFLTINGVKYEQEKVAIKVEKIENIDEENSKGRVLDAKK